MFELHYTYDMPDDVGVSDFECPYCDDRGTPGGRTVMRQLTRSIGDTIFENIGRAAGRFQENRPLSADDAGE